MRNLFLIIISLIILDSCKESDDPINNIIVDEPVNVKFNFSGDITFSDSPLNGRTESSDEITYYFIKINDTQGGVHASGIFDHIPNDASVTLFKDRTYTLEVSAMRKGDSYWLWKANDSTIYLDRSTEVIRNKFTYSTSLGFALNQNNYIRYYTTSDSSAYATSSNYYSGGLPLNIYYGLKTIDSLALQDSIISVNLVRNVPGYETVESNLSTGALDVSIARQYNRFLPGGDSTDAKVLSFGVNSADSSYYSRNYAISVIHRDTVFSVPVTTVLFNQSVPFKRLHKKNIFITAPADTTGTEMNNNHGFTFSFEDTPMIEGDTLLIN